MLRACNVGEWGRGLGAVLFTDIVGSTAVAAEMGNARWGELVSVTIA